MPDFGLRFAPAGNVTAATIGAPPPDCGPKSQPVIGPTGRWECQSTEGEHGGFAKPLLWIALGFVLWHEYSKRYAGRWERIKKGDMGALL